MMKVDDEMVYDEGGLVWTYDEGGLGSCEM